MDEYDDDKDESFDFKDTKLYRILTDYPDEKRHPLIVGSNNWENLITPALKEWTELIQFMPMPVAGNLLRCVIEAVYVMGYNKGKSPKDNILSKFVVSEEKAEER